MVTGPHWGGILQPNKGEQVSIFLLSASFQCVIGICLNPVLGFGDRDLGEDRAEEVFILFSPIFLPVKSCLDIILQFDSTVGHFHSNNTGNSSGSTNGL